MNQPPRGAALKKIEPQRKMPPSRKHQNPKAETRGNGRSRAPSMAGRNRIAIDSKIGIAKRNIMTEPWTVKTWLYISAERNWLPGTASWMRIIKASTPPKRKNRKVVAVYQRPT